MKEFVHTRLVRHPLRDAWMVVNVTFPFIPPYIGTKKECVKAQKYAEINSMIKAKKQLT